MTYKKRLKQFTTAAIAVFMAFSLLACGSSNNTENTSTSSISSAEVTDAGVVSLGQYTYDDEFTERDLNASYDESDIKATVALSGTDSYTITSEGVYVFSGTLTEGQIVVDAVDAKVQIVLSNVDITSSTSAAIYVKNADKVFLTLADGSTNTLTTSSEFEADGDINVDGTIFSKSDLTINGSGSLILQSTNHGIVGKDDLKICGGNLNITALGHGITGNDSIRVASSDAITINAGTDGLHSGNDEIDEKGYIYINDANLAITCGSDAIDAEYICQIDGGDFSIEAGDDAIHSDADLYYNGGTCDILSCYEGFEGLTITINDGDINIVSSDDGMNAAGDLTGSTPSNEDVTTDAEFEVRKNFNSTDKPENFEPGNTPDTDNFPQDNQRPDGDFGGDKMGGNMGGGMMEGNDAYVLTINGGNIHVKTGGDGLDSNGLLYLNGGNIIVEGPTNDGNASIDFGTTAYINGGTLITLGSSGMVESFSDASTQGCITYAGAISAGDKVSLMDADGNELISYTSSVSCSCVQFSCSEIKSGSTYTLKIGETTNEITMDSNLYSNTAGFGGKGGSRPR